MNQKDIETLAIALPEDILKAKWCGDFDRAYDAVELAAQQWHSREAVYCVLLHHDETDCVQRDLAALREQARRGEGDDFADTCAQLITQLQHLRALQLPSAGNIF